MKLAVTILALVLTGCSGCPSPSPSDAGPAGPDVVQEAASAGATTKVIVSNTTDAGAVVNIAVGADSVVQPSAWAGCPDAGLTCSFRLRAAESRDLPTGGAYLNASIAFNGPVGCGSTIAEYQAGCLVPRAQARSVASWPVVAASSVGGVVSSGSKLQRSERHRRPLEITLDPVTLEKLNLMAERLQEPRSKIIETLIANAPVPRRST